MLITLFVACMSKTVPPRLEKRIGEDFAQAIAKESSYTLYSLQGEEESQLSSEQTAKIQEFLLDPGSYVFGANVRCRLRPNRAVGIKIQDQEYKILFAKGGKCPKLRFVSKGQKSVISLKPKRHNLFQSLIP